MHEPHVIRLRGPWEYEVLARYSLAPDGAVQETIHDPPTAGKTTVPGDWAADLGADFLGRVRYRRRFNTPTNLEHEWVFVACDGVDCEGRMLLNGQELGRLSRQLARFDINARLALHNVLEVEVSLLPSQVHDPLVRGERVALAGGPVGEIRLEIER